MNYCSFYLCKPVRTAANIFATVIFISAALAVPANAFDGNVSGRYELRGGRLTAHFQVLNGSLKVAEIEDQSSHTKLMPGEVFTLLLRDGGVLAASQLRLNAEPVEEAVEPNP